jgi:protein-S-isoprenylcysteine O-methyltransferase Ste14
VNDVDEATWRKRFILMNLLQIAGTVLVLFSLLLWQTSYIVEGGTWLGFPLALVGLVISFFGPRTLATHWKKQNRGQ